MQTTTAAWNTAAGLTETLSRLSGHTAPIFLVDFLSLNRTFGSRAYAPGGPRTFGDGGIVGSGLLFAGVIVPAELGLLRLSDQGISSLSMEVQETANSVRVSTARVSFQNQEAFALGFVSPSLKARIRIRLGFLGLGPADFLSLFTGVVDRDTITRQALMLDILDGAFRLHRNLSIAIGGQYFPGAPVSSRSKFIPLLVGAIRDAPTIQVQGAAVGTLAFAMSTGHTVLYLNSVGATFPNTGTITINAETGVTYSSREIIHRSEQSYLRLNGLVRGAPVTHAVDETVTLTTAKYLYLIGYQVRSLQQVRNNGVYVQPANYTLQTLDADRKVSVLEFTTQQGTVTVYANSGNLDETNLLTNGGFETGDTTGWVTGVGATAVVGTVTPDPEDGTYRLALTGALADYKDFYQEWITRAGDRYVVSFSFLHEDSNLLTNGGFETGGLDGWTVTPPIPTSRGPAVYPAGQRIVIGNQTILYPAADGNYLVIFQAPLENQAAYENEIYQDVATTVGLTYVLGIRHISIDYVQFAINATDSRQGFAGFKVGTTGDPGSIISYTRLPPAITILIASDTNDRRGNGYALHSRSFVATSTTTRITVVATGTSQGLVPAALPVVFDALRLQQASVLDTSESALQLGTPATPGLYRNEDLGTHYVWTRKVVSFVATAALTRLTWRSRFTGPSRASFFDRAVVQRVFSAGDNPIEVIAYIIDTFLQPLQRNQASFDLAYTKLLGWRYGGSLTDPGESRALLQRMGEQCNTLIYEDGNGKVVVQVLDATRLVQREFSLSNIIADTFMVIPEPLDTVYSEFYIWFAPRTGARSSSEDFQGVTFATPTESTHPVSLFLSILCETAETIYGRPHRLDIFAEFISDFTTANLLLEQKVQRNTSRHDVLHFETWIDAAPLQLGDMVLVEHAAFLSHPVFAEVVSWAVVPDTMRVRLSVRALQKAAWLAEFELPSPLDGGSGWSTEFDA